MMRKGQIPQTIPNIKIASHNKKIVNIYFSILKILWGWMRRVRVDIYNEWTNVVIEKEDKENISVINNIILKREL